ncbi:hypothetical protein Tco_1448537 [Tanacetum coccineum]
MGASGLGWGSGSGGHVLWLCTGSGFGRFFQEKSGKLLLCKLLCSSSLLGVGDMSSRKVFPKSMKVNLSKLIHDDMTSGKNFYQYGAHVDIEEHCTDTAASSSSNVRCHDVGENFPRRRVTGKNYEMSPVTSGKTKARRVSSTNASRSNPRSNTKNDKILQPSSRSMKNKVEAHHRKFKSSANKNNHVSDCNANVKNKMQKSRVAKSGKQKVTSEWKPTGRIFITVGLKWVPTGRMFTLVESKYSSSLSQDTTTKILPNRQIPRIAILVDVPCPKLSLRYANARESLFKCMVNSDIPPTVLSVGHMTWFLRGIYSRMKSFHLGSSTI